MPILSALADVVVEHVSITHEITVTVRALSPTAPCPCCGTSSKRVQSWYTRMLCDLPASGRPVHLIVRVRRFFCHELTCPRKIFAERL
jgi:transposase